MKKALLTILLLTCSNSFMNIAWYGHLKFKSSPLYAVILVSWGIAFFEYCLQVPANRIGSDTLTIVQLKVIQEVLSIGTFGVIAFLLFHQRPTANQYISFVFIILAAYFAVRR